jgi:hypothetical protein
MIEPNIGDGRGDNQWKLADSYHVLGAVRGVEPNRRLHPLVVGHRSQSRCSCSYHPAQRLDDTPGHDVLGTTIHDVELLAALVVAGIRVRVVVDGLERPLGILELPLLLLVTLRDNLLLAFPLAGEACHHGAAATFAAHGTTPRAS